MLIPGAGRVIPAQQHRSDMASAGHLLHMLKQFLKIPDFFVTETRELERGETNSLIFLMHFLTLSSSGDSIESKQPNFSFPEPVPDNLIS